jgi:pimeloyl-ACP methyl ester carboxylesterase
VQITAVQTEHGAMAFALYTPPQNFSRGSGFNDDTAAMRSIFLHAQSNQNSGYLVSLYADLVRPPVLLVHGLWSGPDTWSHFDGLNMSSTTANTPSGQFWVRRAVYNQPLNVISSDPQYGPGASFDVSSMGLQYDAPVVQGELFKALDDFRKGQNPAYEPVAAAQADVVAHSMGGLIVRAMQSRSDFLDPGTFGMGLVHKLITIGTPHLGTPVAALLLNDSNSCSRSVLASFQNGVFRSVTTETNGTPNNGAFADLAGYQTVTNSAPFTSALPTLAANALVSIPTATIAGQALPENASEIQSGLLTSTLNENCGGDPFPPVLTPEAWPGVFGYVENDELVSVTSQTDAFAINTTQIGVIHSDALHFFGFQGPGELDPNAQTGIPNIVVNLLNAPLPSGGPSSFNGPFYMLP